MHHSTLIKNKNKLTHSPGGNVGVPTHALGNGDDPHLRLLAAERDDFAQHVVLELQVDARVVVALPPHTLLQVHAAQGRLYSYPFHC